MSWLGFNTATTGMFTSQRKLYTVNHNVANADREGYSRQKIKSSSTMPLHIAGQGYIGTGIGIDSIDRVRDAYLDKKFRTETASLGEWDIKNSGLSEIEGVLRGSKEEGINVNMDELFSSIEDLSTNPSDSAYRTAFREKAISFTKTMNETVKRIYKQQKDLNFEVKTKIKQVNDYSEQIRSLNSEIFSLEVDGSSANDLRDQRDLIVDKLSKIVDIEAEERVINVEETKSGIAIEIKKYEVRIGGISLVDHDMVSKLKYPPNRMENPVNPEETLYQLEWESGGDVKLKGGELKGLLDVRDGGSDAKNKSNGIPFYIKRLDELSREFADNLNRIHIQGTSLNGSKTVPLFDVPNGVKPEYGEVSVAAASGDVNISKVFIDSDETDTETVAGVTTETNTKVFVEVYKNDILIGKLSSDGKTILDMSTGLPKETLNINAKTTADKITLKEKTEIITTIGGAIQPFIASRKDMYEFTQSGDNFIIKPLLEDGLNSIVIKKSDNSFKDDSFKGTQDESGNIYVSREPYVDFIKRKVRADDIKVSHEILTDLNYIATIKGDGSNLEDNSIMKDIIKTRENTDFFGKGAEYRGKPEDYLTSVLSTLGTDNQQSQRMKTVQDSIVKGAVNQRLSVSGVNLDEEMADMVKFQQIFNASAKMISTFDQMYDTIVNRLGMVGR